MKRYKISDLQTELMELSEKFEQNMQVIEILFRYCNDELDFNEKFPPIMTCREAHQERLRLINENFEINNRRIEIYKSMQDSQIEFECHVSDERKKEPKFEFLKRWVQQYAKEGDVLMVEILDILNK
jgi:hypothetical protein